MDDMMVYKENSFEYTKKLLELLKETRKLAGHKSNIKKSIVFLQTGNKESETNVEKYNLQQHWKY